MPADFGSPEELAEMVYEVNMEQVDINDCLSNQVYHYDKDLRTLRLATDTINKSLDDVDLEVRENTERGGDSRSGFEKKLAEIIKIEISNLTRMKSLS